MFLTLAGGGHETWVTMERELLLSPSLFPEPISQPTVLNQTTRGLKLTVSDARSIIQSKNSIIFTAHNKRTCSVTLWSHYFRSQILCSQQSHYSQSDSSALSSG